MTQPGMRITVDAAMRARDVSRPGDDEPDSPAPPPEPPKPRGLSKNERRRLGKRGTTRR
ncbi:hypothetical protein [Thermomonospora umbrina]|uniref:Uncharacterized protein n=1 Tax=Thermomonospora umbrina TaxID=111806 RepID=A0A3D9SIF2_9ACTN|nr:hypothetical protein [Thermomonospora umbrina]REE95682.1 hypothetical protein DFJ69_1091 [Thermomonospora umbrina]